ncbi:hypothetical protein SDJN02_04310 [Cucurbita argyrosperma subsp. argyrosperma]|nr:hypothetical protein SDJN02_04310 [Cucurbita argyrosperma subsp. argyrosperma]
MEEDFEFGDKVPPAVNRMGNVIGDADGRGFNPGLIVLLVVGGLLLAFLVVNYALYIRPSHHKRRTSFQEEDEKGETKARYLCTWRNLNIITGSQQQDATAKEHGKQEEDDLRLHAPWTVLQILRIKNGKGEGSTCLQIEHSADSCAGPIETPRIRMGIYWKIKD